MRTDPRATGCDLTQQRIELGPAFASLDRIDPHKHAINRQKLPADFVLQILVVDRGLGIDADCRQLFEDAVKATILGSCGAPCLAITAPQNCNSIRFSVGHIVS